MVEQDRRLLQAGVSLVLLALLIGLAIPALAVPRLGVAAHVNGLLGGLALLVLGLLWPKLQLGPRAVRVAFWLAIYSFFVATLMPLLGGVWAAGATILPMAAGTARGTFFQEAVIATGLATSAISVIALFVVLLLGLRGGPREP